MWWAQDQLGLAPTTSPIKRQQTFKRYQYLPVTLMLPTDEAKPQDVPVISGRLVLQSAFSIDATIPPTRRCSSAKKYRQYRAAWNTPPTRRADILLNSRIGHRVAHRERSSTRFLKLPSPWSSRHTTWMT